MVDKTALKDYYYDAQVERYFIQFMAIFTGLQCQIGKNDRSGDENKLIPVPLFHGKRDRVAGWIKAGFTQNKLLRLPIMSSAIVNLEMAPESRKGIGQVRRVNYVPRGGLIPNDIQSVTQYMPIPYRLFTDVFIWTSNVQQRYQILEQLLMVFDPTLQIQSTDAQFDWTKITSVELVGINYEDNYPIGNDARLLITTLNFSFPIYISPPADYRSNFVKDVYMRIGAIEAGSITNEEIISDLDSQDIEYEEIFDGDDIEDPEE